MSVYSEIEESKYLHRGNYFFLISDIYPVSDGHILIISNEEKDDFFSLNDEERKELNKMILVSKELIEKEHSPDGYNIGMNCGEVAGQSVMHFHCHVIPRYKGDVENPKGGVRGVISSKQNY